MFSEYLSKQGDALAQALKKNLGKRGVKTPEGEKDLGIYQEFYTFLKDHIPAEFSLASGKVRNKKHLLNRNVDLAVYRKWAPRMLEMAGGYVLADTMHAFVTLEAELEVPALATHVNLTRALKSLYIGEAESEGQVIPMYSILFSYGAPRGLMMLKKALQDLATEKEIPINQEPDMVAVLNQGLIIKDWERAGDYKVIETGEDTLMWFYILFMEYLDRDGTLNLNLRDYVKANKEYPEY